MAPDMTTASRKALSHLPSHCQELQQLSPDPRATRLHETLKKIGYEQNIFRFSIGELKNSLYFCPRFQERPMERCRSGRSGRSRKPLYPYGYPGFESLSFRQQPSHLGWVVLFTPTRCPAPWVALSTSRYTPLSCSAPLPAGHSLPDTRHTADRKFFTAKALAL